MKASELQALAPSELCEWISDDEVAIHAQAVAERLNLLLAILQEQERLIEQIRRQRCDCMNCIVIGV